MSSSSTQRAVAENDDKKISCLFDGWAKKVSTTHIDSVQGVDDGPPGNKFLGWSRMKFPFYSGDVVVVSAARLDEECRNLGDYEREKNAVVSELDKLDDVI